MAECKADLMPRRVSFRHIQSEKVEQLRISFSLPSEEGEEHPIVLCQFTSRLPFLLERRPGLRFVPFRFLRGGATEQDWVFRGQPGFGKKERLDNNKLSRIISFEISCGDLILSAGGYYRIELLAHRFQSRVSEHWVSLRHAPEGEAFVLVFFVDVFEAAVVFRVDPAVVVVLVADADFVAATLKSLCLFHLGLLTHADSPAVFPTR